MKKQKHFLVSLIISVSCLLVITTVQQLGLLSFLEVKTFDLRVQLRKGQDKGSNEVVIVLVDEASLQSMKSLVGRWPWPRSLFAELNYFLAEYGAKAVLFDILFTEPQVPRNTDGELGEDDIELVTSSISTILYLTLLTLNKCTTALKDTPFYPRRYLMHSHTRIGSSYNYRLIFLN